MKGFDIYVNFFVNLLDGRTCAANVQFYEKLYEQQNSDQPNSTNKIPYEQLSEHLYEHRKDINITRSTTEADEINVAQATLA